MGRGHPFPTDRILVVLSEAKDLPYWEGAKDPFPTNPKMQKINFGRSWRRGTFPSSIYCHVERSEKSPAFMFSQGSVEGAMSNPLN